MSFVPTFLRAVADGWEAAAGRDPVDRHADEARELVVAPPTLAQISALHDIATSGRPAGKDEGEGARAGSGATCGHSPSSPLLDDDPEEVVVPTADLGPDVDVAVDLAEARRELARVQASYDDLLRETAAKDALRAKLDEKNDDLAGKPVHIFRPGDYVLVQVPADSSVATVVEMRDRLDRRFPDTHFAILRGADEVSVVDRDDLANELLSAYTGNEGSTSGIAIGWGTVADRAIAVLTGKKVPS